MSSFSGLHKGLSTDFRGGLRQCHKQLAMNPVVRYWDFLELASRKTVCGL
jgi:hypothetical protein